MAISHRFPAGELSSRLHRKQDFSLVRKKR
jgi:hypothetical protein